jgi:putative hydrolase of the HAD superfamily
MQKLLDIKDVFFDLDHTLWDFETNSKKAYAYIFKKHQININIEHFIEIYEPINFAFWKLFRENKVSKKELKYARLRNTFNTLNLNVSDETIHILAEDYLDNLPNYNTLFDGTFEILDYLKPKYNLHIITNGFSSTQSKKMINSKIGHYFDHIITSESIHVKKPNPKIFFHALNLVNTYTYQSVMIGDSLEADIYGSENVGMQAIHCNFNNNDTDNNVITVTHLTQLKQYL